MVKRDLMAAKVNFGFVPAGFLAPNLGPCCLSTKGQKTPLLKMARLHTLDGQTDKKTTRVDQRPNMRLVDSMISTPAAVSIAPPLIPEEINNYFSRVSQSVIRDFIQLCKKVLFLPNLTLMGERMRGFEFSLIRSLCGENGEQWSGFLQEAPDLLSDYKQTMFVNRVGPEGDRIECSEIFVTMGWELGRMKLDNLLMVKGYPSEILSSKARDIFAFIYIKEIGERIGLNLSYLDQELLKTFTLVPENEVEMALNLVSER